MSTIRLTAEQGGQRIDRFIAENVPSLSRTEAQRLIRSGEVTINDEAARSSHRLEQGDEVTIHLPAPQSDSLIAESIPLTVLYEDEALVAIDKPAGMVVHPAVGNLHGTLVNAALARWPQMQRITGEVRAGIVHRLDKATSGVIVLAKTSEALKALQQQFQTRAVLKRYLALVEGIPDSKAGVIDAPIGRDPRQRQRMAVIRAGRPSVTRYDVAETFPTATLLTVEPSTGRTHQIRVHLAWLGFPVVGDPVYGHRKQLVECSRLFLHAAELEINSPLTGERLHFSAPLPPELETVLRRLREKGF